MLRVNAAAGGGLRALVAAHVSSIAVILMHLRRLRVLCVPSRCRCSTENAGGRSRGTLPVAMVEAGQRDAAGGLLLRVFGQRRFVDKTQLTHS